MMKARETLDNVSTTSEKSIEKMLPMSLQNHLTDAEENALEEFQRRMKNYSLTQPLLEDNFLYYRFLKARDFDVDKAETMLKKHLIWRKVHQIDTLLEDFTPREFYENYPITNVVGFDKEGSIVIYCPAGKLNPYDFMKCITLSDFMKNLYLFGESTVRSMNEKYKEVGEKAWQVTGIFDLDKLTLSSAVSRPGVELTMHFLNGYQDNYPERMKTLFVINAPSYYVIAYSIIKRMMSDALIRKFHIFGNVGFKEELLEIIDADVLPAFLGGNRTDPDGDPLCNTVIYHPGKIPKKYFLSEEERFHETAAGMKKLAVPPRQKKEIKVFVQDGSLLQWVFYTKNTDTGFGINFETSELEVREILPIVKYNTSDGAEKGSLKCRMTGKYIIVFDNSYSWMSSKDVNYRITVQKPNCNIHS